MYRYQIVTIEQATEQAKAEILADVAAGTVPQACASFSELHDYVDANGYGGAFEEMPFCADDRFCAASLALQGGEG